MSDDQGMTEQEYVEAVDSAKEDVKSAVSAYLQLCKQASLVVTKFAVIAETYSLEGENADIEAKSLIHFVENMTPWESYGILTMVGKDIYNDAYHDVGSLYYDEDDDEDF